MADRPSQRKTAFSVLRSRPREVALQVLYQDDLNPGVSPVVGEQLIQDRLTLDEFLEFGQDELLEESGDEDAEAAAVRGLTQFSRDDLLRFARELSPQSRAEDLAAMSRMELAHFVRNDAVEFARALMTGVRRNRPELDQKIAAVAENWTLSRMAATDRNILRLGAYELLMHGTPERVAIDEAVDLAKRFGASQSGPFVNGILHRLLLQKAGDTG
jgi:N utilization substance protein B